MDFSLITHALPETIAVDGMALHLDTRTVRALQALAVTAEDDIPAEVRIPRVAELMLTPQSMLELRRHPKDMAEAYERISEFLRGWPEEGKRKASGKDGILSLTEDHALIVASFRQAYGLSLQELRSLHWWEFRALLRGLPEGTSLSSVMGIRAMDIDPKEPPKVKAAKRKAKEAVALRRHGGRERTGEEIISEAFASL